MRFRLRPGRDPPGARRQPDGEGANQNAETRPEARGIGAFELPLRAGAIKGWPAFAERRNTDAFSLVTHRLTGAVGIDRKGDHVGLGKMDRLGNFMRIREIPWNLHGKSGGQAKAIFSNAGKEIPGALPRIEQNTCGQTFGSLKEEGASFESVDPVRTGSPSPSFGDPKAKPGCSSRLLLLPESE